MVDFYITFSCFSLSCCIYNIYDSQCTYSEFITIKYVNVPRKDNERCYIYICIYINRYICINKWLIIQIGFYKMRFFGING